MDERGLVNQEERELAFQYYRENILGMAQFFTGIVGSKQSQIYQSVGHVVQGMLSGKFLGTLKDEWNSYLEKGKIKADFINSEQNQICFIELLRFLEQEIPDTKRFELLKKIYIVTATEEKSDRDSPVPLQFMQMARELTTGEILVLFAIYRLEGKSVASQAEFIKLLARESDLQYVEIVNKIHQSLFNKEFVKSVRNDATISPILIRDVFTPLGRAFCEYVMHYDKLRSNVEN